MDDSKTAVAGRVIQSSFHVLHVKELDDNIG